MQFFVMTMGKKDLGTHVLSTNLMVKTKYNQKEPDHYLRRNGAPNVVKFLNLLNWKKQKRYAECKLQTL